jgi:small subunit ribosomal protein S13
MSIILSLNLKSKKKLIYLLKDIYGLGLLFSKQICKSLGYDYNIRFHNLKKKDINKLNSIITMKYKYILDSELKKSIYDNIQSIIHIRSYKGVRHTYNLPVNGQRTHTNAKTRK